MTTKNHKSLISAFLDAVNTWKIFVIQVKHANKNNCTAAKRQYMQAMFYWRKKAEALKSEIDSLRLA
jgi:hypothetical protein